MHSYRAIVAAALGCALLLTSKASSALVSVGLSINIAPPPLPVYVQPALPGPGYIWSPGYWAYGETDYYWVPGTWVLPPQPGYLWTPGYWGWGNGAYLWHTGYWGEHVGFYGGVNYGFGYGGIGFEGGYWQHGTFFYNRSVNRIPASVHITNVYNKTVVNNVSVNRVSFNGGDGGIQARPTPTELAVQREQHLQPIAAQRQHEQAARNNPALRAAFNHGNPAIAATAHPGMFSGHGVVAAHGAMAGAGAGAHGPGPANLNRGPGGAPAMNNAAAHHDGAQGGGGQGPGQHHGNGGGQGGQAQGHPGQAQAQRHEGQGRGPEGHAQGREGQAQGHERPQ